MITGCVDECSSDSISIPETIDGLSVTSIGSDAFSYTGLTSVVIPDSVTIIGSRAFYKTPLTSLTLGSSVSTIGYDAFFQTELTSLTIPDSVTSIGSTAFGDTPFKALVIGRGLQSIGSVGVEAFLNACETLESVSIDAPYALGRDGPSNGTYHNRDDELVYYAGYSGLHFGRFYDSQTNYSVAARRCPKLESITLGDNVLSVGDFAFDGPEDMSSLTSLTLGSSIKTIGRYAFNGATSLASLVIPDSVTSIGESAFNNVRSLTSLTLGSGLTSLGNAAFLGATNLTTVTLPGLSLIHI